MIPLRKKHLHHYDRLTAWLETVRIGEPLQNRQDSQISVWSVYIVPMPCENNCRKPPESAIFTKFSSLGLQYPHLLHQGQIWHERTDQWYVVHMPNFIVVGILSPTRNEKLLIKRPYKPRDFDQSFNLATFTSSHSTHDERRIKTQ